MSEMDEILPQTFRITGAPYLMAAALLADTIAHIGGTWRTTQTPGSITYTARIDGGTVRVRLRASVDNDSVLEFTAGRQIELTKNLRELGREIPRVFAQFIRNAIDRDAKSADLQAVYTGDAWHNSELAPLPDPKPATKTRRGRSRFPEDARVIERLIAGDDEAAIKAEWLGKSKRRKLADPDTRFRQLKSEAFKKSST